MDKTKEVSSDAWEATKDGASKAGDAISEKSSDAWEATKEAVSSDKKAKPAQSDNDTVVITEEEDDYTIQ